jgi:hypothetical protein
MLNHSNLSDIEEMRSSLDGVVTFPPPVAAPSHVIESNIIDPPESLRSHSPAPTTATAFSEKSSVAPQSLIRPHQPYTPSSLARQSTIHRSDTLRSVATVLPPYSRWGTDKYEALSGLESHANLDGDNRPRCLQHGWRIWAAVVVVIAITIIAIVAALLQQRNSGS